MQKKLGPVSIRGSFGSSIQLCAMLTAPYLHCPENVFSVDIL